MGTHGGNNTSLRVIKMNKERKLLLTYLLRQRLDQYNNPASQQQQIDLRTYGDLNKLFQAITKKQRKTKIINSTGKAAGTGAKIAIDLLLRNIPGVSAAMTTAQIAWGLFNKPDSKRTNTWLDKLDINDDVSAIVDNKVQN